MTMPRYIVTLYTAGVASHIWTTRSLPDDLGGAVRFIDAKTGSRMYVPGDVRVTCIPALSGDRATGRTTLMLFRAVVQASLGVRVIVVALNRFERENMRSILHRHGFHDHGRLSIILPEQMDRTQGIAGPRGLVYLDHAVKVDKLDWQVKAHVTRLEMLGALAA